jgi:hypothetical protein
MSDNNGLIVDESITEVTDIPENTVKILHDNDVKHIVESDVESIISEKVDQPIPLIENDVKSLHETASETSKPPIIEETLSSLLIKDIIRTDYNDDLIDIINKMLDISPDIFNSNEIILYEIVKDGEINTQDIPLFIMLIQTNYQIIYKLKNVKMCAKQRMKVTGYILKHLIHLLVLLDRIKIHQDKQYIFLKSCDSLIVACIELLISSKIIKPKKFLNLFSCIFCK